MQPGYVQDWNNLAAEYSPLSYNVPHRFVGGLCLDYQWVKAGAFWATRVESWIKSFPDGASTGSQPMRSAFR